ncbi:hypothetical protein AtubIFM54640_000941 [Aspergillus tubingensis]|nr:hypothetical protein AtubIFM54640_000941 [Aspergillus tubingensis]
MCSITDGISGRRVLPVNSHFSGPFVADTSEGRRLPPLPCLEPLPRGPLDPFSANAYASSASRSQYTCPGRSSSPGVEGRGVAIRSSESSAEGFLHPDQSQKMSMWPQELSWSQILNLIAPGNINRELPLQQQCGQKRKESMAPADLDNRRERHRVAEGNRRKNLSQLYRELDSRIHDFFLELAGWHRCKGPPESKVQIVQAAILLIDYMAWIIKYLLRLENKMPSQLMKYLAPQIRCMQLQQLVFSHQKQNQTSQQQLKRLREENQTLVERNKELELRLIHMGTCDRQIRAKC